VRVGTAAVDFRLGRSEAAMATLDTVLRPQSTLDPSQRSYVAKLRVNWAMQAMSSQIQDAVSKNDFAGARALVGQARERVGDDSDATSYLDQITRGLEVSELLARYTAARQANHKAEARALAEQLLARPGLPGNLRSSLEKQLSGAATAAR
jgi:hypothetical protein